MASTFPPRTTDASMEYASPITARYVRSSVMSMTVDGERIGLVGAVKFGSWAKGSPTMAWI